MCYFYKLYDTMEYGCIRVVNIGLSCSQVPLLSATLVEGGGLLSDSNLIRLSCIDEEKLEVGIGDAVEIISPSQSFGMGVSRSANNAILVKQVRGSLSFSILV